MIWIELSTEVEAEAVDAVSEVLASVGHGGVAVEEPVLESAEPGLVEVDPSRPFTVKTYLPEDEQSGEKIRRAEEAIWHLSQLRQVKPLRTKRVAEEDWAEAWKKFFLVQRIGKRVVIKPSWREYEAGAGEVVVELDPGMAFGTGLHPTTRMCLMACERYVRDGTRVLDLGTGSGILAIAAAKLGAAFVVALDVDPVAVEVARRNVALNGLMDRIQVVQGSLGWQTPSEPGTATAKFDLVLANIVAAVIVELAQPIHDVTAPGGIVVCSGIISERQRWVIDALESAALRVQETIADGDWCTVISERGAA